MSYKILVVDDTTFMRKMATDCLKQHGHTIVGEAVNGREGIQKYKELMPDIVMMDLTMPEMNGIDAIKEILTLNTDAVILVCSASNQQEQIFDALEAGAKGYITKPFVSERMNEVIRKYAEPFLIKVKEEEDADAEDEELQDVAVVPNEAQDNEQDDHQDEVQEEPEEEQPEQKVEEVASKAVLNETVKETINGVSSLKSNKGNLSNFITSYMCNWEEETNGNTIQYAVICSEKEDKISIEVTGINDEKQNIQFTFDGFRQLNNWLENHIGSEASKAN